MTQMTQQTPDVKRVAEDRRQARIEGAQRFVEALRRLDRGQQAALRRNAGESLATARGMTWFYGLLSKFGISEERGENLYFLFAGLFCHDRRALRNGGSVEGNLGDSFEKLWRASKGPTEEEADKPKSGVARRFAILLDADLIGEESFRLRQAVKLLLSQGVAIPWAVLLVDLQDWNRADRKVQKAWARSFYRLPDSSTQENNTQESDMKGENHAD